MNDRIEQRAARLQAYLDLSDSQTDEVKHALYEITEDEREACERIAEDWVSEICERLLKMKVTADPGTEKPANFEPDKRTRAAIAIWLLSQCGVELQRRMRERAK